MKTPADSLTLDVPLPPSANRLWRTARGRTYKSAEYKAWLEECRLTLARRARPVRTPAVVEVLLTGRVNERRDGDNFLKPCGDLVQLLGVLTDDNLKHVHKWTLEYLPSAEPAACRVVVRAVANDLRGNNS